MKNKKTIWMIVAVVIVCAVLAGCAGWALLWYLPSKKGITQADVDDNGDTILSNGSSGEYVVRLQVALNKWREHVLKNIPSDSAKVPAAALTEDGIFGKATQEAVQMYFGKAHCTVAEVAEMEKEYV